MDFSTNFQQDALEYFRYLLDVIEHEETNSSDPTNVFRFGIEEKIICSESGHVKYNTSLNNAITLPVPIEKMTNRTQVEEYEALEKTKSEEEKSRERRSGTAPDPVYPQISFQDCLEDFSAPESIEFYSTAVEKNTISTKLTRFQTFPRYLVVSMRLFDIDYTTWEAVKLNVSIDVPDEIDITHLRGTGLQPGETELVDREEDSELFDPEVANMVEMMGFTRNQAERAAFNNKGSNAEQAINWLMSHLDDADINEPLPKPGASDEEEFDPEVANMVEMMGFTRNQAERAAFNNKGSNAEVAINWLMSHLDDPDINDPLPKKGSSSKLDQEVIGQVEMMGFTRNQAERAAFNNPGANAEQAINWLMSHLDDADINDPLPQEEISQVSEKPKLDDGSGKYKLIAFVNHLGSSTKSGHYICHILKEGKWIKYNDEKVVISLNPPRDCAYMYIFQRND